VPLPLFLKSGEVTHKYIENRRVAMRYIHPDRMFTIIRVEQLSVFLFVSFYF